MKNKLMILFIVFGITLSGYSQSNSIKPFSNPAIVYGSSFGEFFMANIRYQDVNRAIKFTSKASVKKFGIEAIKKLYTSYAFNYKLKLQSISKENGAYSLKYATTEYATGKLKTMTIVVENDSCKIVLDKLDIFK